jgi:hypothetical protein
LTLGTSLFTTSGLIFNDTVTSVTLTSLGAVDTAAAKTYDINGSTAVGTGLNNYTITFVTGTLTVNKKALTITVDAGQSKVYGQADPSFSFTITSGSLEFEDQLSGSLVRVQGDDVGDYNITQGSLDNTNYDITFIGKTFEIERKTIYLNGITPQDKTWDDTTTVTVTGTPSLSGVIGEDDVSLSGTPAYSFANAGPGVDIAINISGLSLSGTDASNYILDTTGFEATISYGWIITAIAGSRDITIKAPENLSLESDQLLITTEFSLIILSDEGVLREVLITSVIQPTGIQTFVIRVAQGEEFAAGDTLTLTISGSALDKINGSNSSNIFDGVFVEIDLTKTIPLPS